MSSGFVVSSANASAFVKSTNVPRCQRNAGRVARLRARQVPCSIADAGNESAGSFASWQEEVRMLLDPSLGSSAKEVLLQDLVKRTPEVFSESMGGACKDMGLEGVSDVLRQLREDVLPDLARNGPCYVAKALEEMPERVSKLSKEAGQMPSAMPSSVNANDLRREFRNIFARTPEGLFTPSFRVVSSGPDYEIREYPSLLVAEARMSKGSADGLTEVEAASVMGQSFNSLAGYLFGKNETSTKMEMTTPVVLDKGGDAEESMSFILGEYTSLDEVPKPSAALSEVVALREARGGLYAVTEFSGYATQGECRRQFRKLTDFLIRDGVPRAEDTKSEYKVLIYNGPTTIPSLRKNELLIEIVAVQELEE